MQKMKESYAFFRENGNGTWEVHEDMLRMDGWKNVTIMKSHIMEINKLQDLALNKVAVEMKYFDMFGGTETIQFAMRRADFLALKQAMGK